MGISSANPHETLLVHLGVTKGFKGLVAYAKCNRDSYESELAVQLVFILFCSKMSKRWVWGCNER